MAEHTPGPWEVRHSPVSDLCVVTEDPDGRWICGYMSTDGDPQNEANARLIAAAPDLLRACEIAALWFTGQMPTINSVLETSWPYQGELKELQAAIRKAKGEEV